MKENTSPEERLLRLIRQGTRKSSPSPSTIPSKAKKPIFASTPFKKFLKVSYLNNLLLFFLFLSLLGLGLSLILPARPGPSEIEIKPALPMPDEIKDEDLLKLKPYSYYAQQIGKRQLFVPSIGKKEEGASLAKSLSLREIMQDFSLIGIMEGKSPQAIIEDKKAKKTYFLNRGDYLDEIKITDIQKDKVTLEYQGENFDLFL